MSKLSNVILRPRLLVRMLVSAGLMLYLLSRLNPVRVIERWSNVNWLLLALLIPLLYLLNTALRAARLKIILRSQGLHFPLRWLWLVQLKSSFIVSFVPGGVSGDIYRTVVVGREAQRFTDSVSSIILEKGIGLLALILLSTASLFAGIRWFDLVEFDQIAQPVAVLAMVALATSLPIFLAIRSGLINRLQLSLPYWKQLQELANRLAPLVSKNQTIVVLALLSLILQFMVVLWYFIVARSLHLDVILLALMIGVPVVELLLTIPISVGGVGVRDTALVFLLQPFGASAEEIVSLSLLVAFTATMTRILSGLAFFANSNTMFEFQQVEQP